MKPINLSEECGPLPSGTDLAGYNGYHGNLIITIDGALSWSDGGMTWGVMVEKPSVTASGRKGKPRQVVRLVATEDQTPADLLRHLATMWDVGTVVPGETYDVPGQGGDDSPAENDGSPSEGTGS